MISQAHHANHLLPVFTVALNHFTEHVVCEVTPLPASASGETSSGFCKDDLGINLSFVDSNGLYMAAVIFLSSLMASKSVTLTTFLFIRVLSIW